MFRERNGDGSFRSYFRGRESIDQGVMSCLCGKARRVTVTCVAYISSVAAADVTETNLGVWSTGEQVEYDLDDSSYLQPLLPLQQSEHDKALATALPLHFAPRNKTMIQS